MSYQLDTTSQLYGDQQYLSHVIRGETPEGDRHLFGQRVPSFGIFSFGEMSAGSEKTVVLADENIISSIQLTSVYAFNNNASNDEIRFSLFRAGTEIAEMRLTGADMPYQFPKGAIIAPDLAIRVRPRFAASQVLIYWQPVHILKYVAVRDD